MEEKGGLGFSFSELQHLMLGFSEINQLRRLRVLGAVGRIPEKCRIMETMGSESLIKNKVDYVKCSY